MNKYIQQIFMQFKIKKSNPVDTRLFNQNALYRISWWKSISNLHCKIKGNFDQLFVFMDHQIIWIINKFLSYDFILNNNKMNNESNMEHYHKNRYLSTHHHAIPLPFSLLLFLQNLFTLSNSRVFVKQLGYDCVKFF